MKTGYEEIQKASTNARIKFLLKDSIVYGGVSAASKFLHVFTLPLLTRVFSREQYGIFDALTVIGGLIIPIIILGTDSSIARFFYEIENNEIEKKKQLVSQTLLFEIIFSITICACFYLNSRLILNFYLDSIQYNHAFRVLLISIPFVILVRFSQNLLKWTFRRAKFLIISAGSIVSVLSLTIIFILVLEREIIFIFYAQLIGMFLFSIIGLYFCKDFFVIPKNFKYILPQLKFGYPFMITCLITSLLPTLDRYFIAKYLNLRLLGIYAVGNKLSQFSQIAINGFQIAWGPLAYSIMKEDNKEKTYNKVFQYYSIFIALFIFFLTLFSKQFILLFSTSEYLPAIYIMLPLILSKLILSASGISAVGIDLSKRTYYHVLSDSTGIAVTVTLILIFIKPLGLIGVASSILIGRIVNVILKNYVAYKINKVKFYFKNPIILLSFSTFIACIYLISINSHFIYKIPIAGIWIGFIILFSWNKLLDISDKDFILKKVSTAIKMGPKIINK